MKNFIWAILAVVVFSGCSMVEPGFVGIRVNSYGDNKGVEDYPVETGRVWYNPFTTTIYEYPTFTQNMSWQGPEKISFNTSQGSRISCDVGLSYAIKADKVPHLFVKHRKDLDYITHNYLRNKVRDAINKHSAEYTAIDALGGKLQELLSRAKADLIEELEPEGFVIDTLSFISAPEADDPSVTKSISDVISSTQRAIEAENKVKQIEAEARQEVARAEGKALAILAEAKAQADANKILAESLTDGLIRYKIYEKWNGELSRISGGDGMQFLMQLPTENKDDK